MNAKKNEAKKTKADRFVGWLEAAGVPYTSDIRTDTGFSMADTHTTEILVGPFGGVFAGSSVQVFFTRRVPKAPGVRASERSWGIVRHWATRRCTSNVADLFRAARMMAGVGEG